MTLEDKRIIEKAKVDTIQEAEKELAKQLGPEYEVRSSFTNYTFFVKNMYAEEFVTIGEYIKAQESIIAELTNKVTKLTKENVELKTTPIPKIKKPVVKNFDSSKAKEFIPKPVEPFVTPIKNDNNEITW